MYLLLQQLLSRWGHMCECVCDHIKHVGAQEADMGEGGSLGVQKLECVRV